MLIVGHSMANQEPCTPDLETLRAQAVVQGDAAVLSAVNQNTELLQQLFERLQANSLVLDPEEAFDEFNNLGFRAADDNAIEAVDENIRLREENSRLNQLINQLEAQVASLSKNNHDLAQKVVYGEDRVEQDSADPSETENHPAETTSESTPTSEGAFTWEERKQQILEQLENDSFDAETFLTTLDIKHDHGETPGGIQDAIDYVIDLNAELDRHKEAARETDRQSRRYCDEIRVLKDSIRQFEETIRELRDAVPTEPVAAAIDPVEAILDADQLIRQERERLATLQEACDQKVREIEINASLERAKFSRELTVVEQRNKELETQVHSLQRSAGRSEDGGIGTRWMAKLGLTGESDS